MIGKTLQDLRKARGLSQGEAAIALGVSQRVMSALEREESNPTIQQIEALTKFYGVSSDYLLFGKEQKTVTPVERELLSLIRDDSGLYNSLTAMLSARKNVTNRLAA